MAPSAFFKKTRAAIRDFLSLAQVFLRYVSRFRVGPWPRPSSASRLEFSTLVINLPERVDRRLCVGRELDQLALPYSIIPGVRDENGALGCALAHIASLESFSVEGQRLLMICEDDIRFLVGRERLLELMGDFWANDRLDVLCIGNNVQGKRLPVSGNIDIAFGIQTASCYVLKPDAIGLVLEVFKSAADDLAQGTPVKFAAIDVRWKYLQTKKLLFGVPREKVAEQMPSFSDIERVNVDYGT